MWQDWLNGIFGLWIVVLAFLDISKGTLTWALVITGFAIAILSFWTAAFERPDASPMGMRRPEDNV
jgi:hypothetical protein